MPLKLPPCGDFIIAAIREMRVKPSHMKANTAASISIGRLFKVATEVYAADEFNVALAELTKKGLVVLFAHHQFWVRVQEVDGERREESMSGRAAGILDALPPFPHPEKGSRWDVDEENKWVDPATIKEGMYRILRGVRIYVKADGLPQNVKTLLAARKGTAMQIIAAMRKKEKR